MSDPITIKDVRMYPDGMLYELVTTIKDPDDHSRLKLAKEMLDIQHWDNIKKMLNNPQDYGVNPKFVSHAKKHKIVKPGDNVAWIVPDDNESPNPNHTMVQ